MVIELRTPMRTGNSADRDCRRARHDPRPVDQKASRGLADREHTSPQVILVASVTWDKNAPCSAAHTGQASVLATRMSSAGTRLAFPATSSSGTSATYTPRTPVMKMNL